MTRYLKRPPVGAQLENGRYGLVTVEQVQQNGLVLIVRTSRGDRERVERAPNGHWVRTEGSPV